MWAERHIDSESETAVKEYIKELKQINQLESETIQNRRTFDHPVLHNRISTIIVLYHTDIIYTPCNYYKFLQKECCQAGKSLSGTAAFLL